MADVEVNALHALVTAIATAARATPERSLDAVITEYCNVGDLRDRVLVIIRLRPYYAQPYTHAEVLTDAEWTRFLLHFATTEKRLYFGALEGKHSEVSRTWRELTSTARDNADSVVVISGAIEPGKMALYIKHNHVATNGTGRLAEALGECEDCEDCDDAEAPRAESAAKRRV